MIYAIKGIVSERYPTYVVMDVGGVYYQLMISLNTYSQLEGIAEIKLLTHQIIKEDGHYLYGFFNEAERQIFIHLISVSGIGPNTARLVLSSLDTDSIRNAILLKDDTTFRRIKGLGPKTAQRIIVDLYDKIGKDSSLNLPSGPGAGNTTIRMEALSALQALGFSKPSIEQVFKNLPELNEADMSLEKLIKAALKNLA